MKKGLFLSVFCILIQVPAFALGGDHVENGGDSYSLEFTQIGSSILASMKSLKNPLLSIADFQKVLEETQVISEDRLFLNGREVDAINTFLPQRIRISRKRWLDLTQRKSLVLKEKLVLHEYLGVMGFDDTAYTFSNALIDSLNKVQKGLITAGPINSLRIRGAGLLESCTDINFANEIPWSDKQIFFKCENSEFELSLIALDSKEVSAKKKHASHFEIRIKNILARSESSIQYLPMSVCLAGAHKTCTYSGWITLGQLQIQLLYKNVEE